MIVASVPYNVKRPEATVVFIWCCTNKYKVKSVFSEEKYFQEYKREQLLRRHVFINHGSCAKDDSTFSEK